MGDIPNIHFEVKGTQRFEPYPNYAQASGDAGEGKAPVVIHKKSRGDWMVFLSAEDFFRFYKKEQ